MDDEESQQLVCPPVGLGFVPPTVEADHMVGNREAKVEDGDCDGHLISRDQEPNQPRLEHVGREEGEEHDDQGEHQTHVLDAAQR